MVRSLSGFPQEAKPSLFPSLLLHLWKSAFLAWNAPSGAPGPAGCLEEAPSRDLALRIPLLCPLPTGGLRSL